METKHNRVVVKSSAVASVGYNPQTKIMQVEMASSGGKPGKVYDYPGVPEDAHKAFMGAESMGKHLASHIRPRFSANK